MKLEKIIFTKAELYKVPEDERIFLILISRLADEVSTLHKLLIFSNYHVEGETYQTAQNFQSFFLVQQLAQKLYAGHEVLRRNYFGIGSLARQYDRALPEQVRNALKEIKSYFSKDNLIKEIRDKFTAHYDAKVISDELDGLPEDEELVLYFGDKHAHSLYAMVHIIASYALLNKVNPKDDLGALEKIFDEVLGMADLFLTFIDGVLIAIWQKYQIQARTETVRLDAPDIDSIRLPFFISRKG